MAENTVTLIGNVTRDPELRFTPSGASIASFGLAVNRFWNDRQTGERKEQTSFFDIACWGQLGQNVAESLAKGTRVVVTGRLEQRSWETEQGDKRSKVEVVADEVGPSLRWATASVTKNERSTGSAGSADGGGGGGGSYNRPAPTQPAGQSQGGYDPSEEPF